MNARTFAVAYAGEISADHIAGGLEACAPMPSVWASKRGRQGDPVIGIDREGGYMPPTLSPESAIAASTSSEASY